MKRLSPHTRKRCQAAGFYLVSAAAFWMIGALDPLLGPGFGALFGALIAIPVLLGLLRAKPYLHGWALRAEWRTALEISTFMFTGVLAIALLLEKPAGVRACGVAVLIAGAAAEWLWARPPVQQGPPPVG